MEIHKNYQTMLEQKLETIIIKSGINVNQFYLSLKSVTVNIDYRDVMKETKKF